MMTYLFDPAKAMEELTALETGWGGDVNARMAKKAAAWKAASDSNAAVEAAAQGSVDDTEIKKTTDSEAARTSETPVNRDAAAAPEPETASGPVAQPIAPVPNGGETPR
jgi:penicillin-binding protein 2